MMRILLPSGEETVYRTVEELAMGISSGMITAGARFFDSPSQGWRSIDAHPEYHAALARAANFGPGIDLEPPTGGSATPVIPEIQAERTSGSLQIYQMFSLSAAELQAKKRPAWLLPALAGLAALTLLVSLLIAYRGSRSSEITPEEAPQLAITEVPVSNPRLPAPSSVEAMRLAPMNLNSHLTFAMEVAGRRLKDSAEAIGARALLSRGRLLSADSVRQTRDMLVALRALVSNYRLSQRHAQDAYRDTAAMLVKSGFWSRIDQQEWKVYPSSGEPAVDAARADSVLDHLEELYDLLETQPHAYREVEGRIHFDDPARGAQYDRIRLFLGRFDGPAEDFPSRSSALNVLRRAASTSLTAPRPDRVSLP